MYRTDQVFLLLLLLSSCIKIRGQFTLSRLNGILNGRLHLETIDKAIWLHNSTNTNLNKIENLND